MTLSARNEVGMGDDGQQTGQKSSKITDAQDTSHLYIYLLSRQLLWVVNFYKRYRPSDIIQGRWHNSVSDNVLGDEIRVRGKIISIHPSPVCNFIVEEH